MKLSLMMAAAVLVAGAASGAQAAVITPAYEYTSVGSLSDSRDFTLGFSFSLSSAVTLSALGYSDFLTSGSQQVGLWDSSNNLIASATVSSADTVVGHFHWASISPLALAAGTYTLGGTYTGGPFASYASGVTTASQFTWLGDKQLQGSGLIQPTGTYGGYGDNGIPLVNMSFGAGAVPEPATWALMISGFGLAGVSLRSRRRAVA